MLRLRGLRSIEGSAIIMFMGQESFPPDNLWNEQKTRHVLSVEGKTYVHEKQEYPWYYQALTSLKNRQDGTTWDINELNEALDAVLHFRVLLQKAEKRNPGIVSNLFNESEESVGHRYLEHKKKLLEQYTTLTEKTFSEAEVILDNFLPLQSTLQARGLPAEESEAVNKLTLEHPN